MPPVKFTIEEMIIDEGGEQERKEWRVLPGWHRVLLEHGLSVLPASLCTQHGSAVA